jgi:hypothetical protein
MDIERLARDSALANMEGFVKVGIKSTVGTEWVWCVPVDPLDEDNKLLKITSVTHFAEATADDIIEVGPDPDGTHWKVMTKMVERARTSVLMKHGEVSGEDWCRAREVCEGFGVKIAQVNRVASVFAFPIKEWDRDSLDEIFDAAEEWMGQLEDWPEDEVLDLNDRGGD